MRMKKNYLYFSLVALASLALTTSCNKAELNAEKNNSTDSQTVVSAPFEIIAKYADSKTANDGMSTDWAANDGINLFHREHGATGDFSSNDQFTISSENLAAGKFSGSLTEALEDGKSYDWYALYPYNAGYTTPANNTYSGSIGSTQRTQVGYNSTSHLNGTTMPLVGMAEDVANDETPSLTMSHIASLVKIIVTNNTANPLTITSVSITAPENIVGSFKLDFSNPDNVGITDGAYAKSATADLKVTGGTALANGESATFYIPIKPIDLEIGDELTVKVNTFSKVLTMTKAVSFSSGEIKTINFNYNKTFVSQNFSLASSISAGDKIIITDGINGEVAVMGRFSSGSNISAVSGTITTGILPSTSSMGIYAVEYDADKGFSFYDEEQELYLNATSSGNTLKALDAEDDYKYWTVTITEGVAEILNKGRNTYHIRKNSSNPLFSTYSSAQKSVYIFKYEPRTPVTLTFDESSLEYTTSNYASLSVPGLTATPNVSAITDNITYSISDPSGITTGFSTSTGSYSLNGSEGTATITATFGGDANYIAASDSYTVSVSSGPKTYYRKVTSAPADWGGTYLLVSETGSAAFNGSYNGTTGAKSSSVTISDSKIESNTTVDAYAVTIAKVGDHYSIKHGSSYLGWASGNAAQSYDGTDSDNALNDFAISSGAAIIKSAADNTRILRYNPGVTEANGRLRYYTSNTGSVVVLYKKD